MENVITSEVKKLSLAEKTKEARMKLDAKIEAATVMGFVFLSNIGMAYATDMWTQGTSAAQDVYNKVVTISTPIAAASLVILWLFRLFTHNEQAITKSRTASKAIALAWVGINGLGYILVYAKSILGEEGKVTFDKASIDMIMSYLHC